MAGDLPRQLDDDFERVSYKLPTDEEREQIQSTLKPMQAALDEMAECAASGDLLRLLHASHRLQEHNCWLAGSVDKVMDCRS